MLPKIVSHVMRQVDKQSGLNVTGAVSSMVKGIVSKHLILTT
jgi:hypothetical protein